MTSEQPNSRIRWRIVTILVGFSVVSYVERMNISVAAKYMMPELGLTQIQIGQVFASFMLGYSLFQAPVGALADRFGPYVVLASLGWSWAALTILTGYIPGNLFGVGTAAFVSLLLVRFLLGTTVAGTYPVSALTISRWHPVPERAFAFSLSVAGVSIGSAITPPIVALAMVALGWRASFYVASILSVVVAIVWMWYGADGPRTHPSVSRKELNLILGEPAGQTGGAPAVSRTPSEHGAWWRLLRNRSYICLCIATFLSGHVLYTFVFWLFTYLVDVRKFSIVGSSVFASMPFIAAGILSPVGGYLCDWYTARLGRRWGRRVTALAGPLIAAVFLFVGTRSADAYLAVATLALGFGFHMFGETASWSATMDISGRLTGTATGIFNMMNNLGGVLSTALMPVLIARFGWVTALDTVIAVAVLIPILWAGIRADQPIEAAQ